MIKKTYVKKIKDRVKRFEKDGCRFFIFGSCLTKGRFGDVDLGFVGPISEKDLARFKEELEESDLPYSFDVVNFNEVSENFKSNVLNQKVLWLS